MKVEELNKIFEIENIIDRTILSNSDELMLNENEKKSFYKMKCFLDELESRFLDKKIKTRININIKGVK